ncbi:MAG: hypothetical protein ACTH3E_09855 [Psychroflexus halocasei]|nr:hypothetical protein [Psychroflexus sp.]
MALKIVWTPQAEIGLTKVLDYLEKEWTKKEIIEIINFRETKQKPIN